MELSSIEINLLTKGIAEVLSGYFLSGVYSIESGALLRFNHTERPERQIALSSFAPWVTTKNLTLPSATKFISRLRDKIERTSVLSFEQVGNERIVRISFVTRSDEKINLYSEFFAHGNLILTNASQNETILEVENPQEFRHRKLAVGEKYTLPPTRGIALQSIGEQQLLEIYRASVRSAEEKNVPLIKWFGRNVGTSRKFVEEIFTRSMLDPMVKLGSVDESSIIILAESSSMLADEVKTSRSGHILMPAEDSNIEPDVCPLIPHSWRSMVEKKLATIQSYPSLSLALDEVQIQHLVLTKQRKASTEARAKAEELASAISKQQARIRWNSETSVKLREYAGVLMSMTEKRISPGILQVLMDLQIVEIPQEAPNRVRFVNEPKSFIEGLTNTSLASRLFDEAKKMEASNQKLQEVIVDLEAQKSTLLVKTRSQEERATRQIAIERRERQWYERYRWFFTSDGRLTVGGRDATSNSVIVNKYLKNDDVVFHADLHGSPFFVLQSAYGNHEPSDEIARELAQATVSFSRAWKDELGSADAYWVYGNQLKKSAPSGEYLPRGSFFVEGKKNFIRHLKVELSLGVAVHLPNEGNTLGRPQTMIIACGPDKSIAGYCISKVKIAPGRDGASECARNLKQRLIAAIKDQEDKELAKKVTIDEIIRALPSGGCKIVSENR